MRPTSSPYGLAVQRAKPEDGNQLSPVGSIQRRAGGCRRVRCEGVPSWPQSASQSAPLLRTPRCSPNLSAAAGLGGCRASVECRSPPRHSCGPADMRTALKRPSPMANQRLEAASRLEKQKGSTALACIKTGGLAHAILPPRTRNTSQQWKKAQH